MMAFQKARMMMFPPPASLVVLSLVVVVILPFIHGFCCCGSGITKSPTTRTTKWLLLDTTTTLSSTRTRRFASTTNNNKNVNDIKHDIEEMRQEALRRLEALNHKVEELSIASTTSSTTTATEAIRPNKMIQTPASVTTTATSQTSPTIPPVDKVTSELTEKPIERDFTLSQSASLAPPPLRHQERQQLPEVEDLKPKVDQLEPERSDTLQRNLVAVNRLSQQQQRDSNDDLNLLDGTHWKVMLNIGREPGTWMPKTWGASGERLLLHMEVEFTSHQLYEREDFLNGIGGAKQLYVTEFTTAPSMNEGSRPIPVQPMGGWRISRGEGPAGTDLLRFYVEVDEAVRHAGSDVHCPDGRIYFTCGYFPLTHRNNNNSANKLPSLKDMLREEHDAIVMKYEALTQEMEEDSNWMSWDRWKRSKELLDLRSAASQVARQMEEAKLREPEKASLRLSKKRNVGLTQEGGLCRKVIKGMTMEYHILGKFGVACIERDP